MSYNVARYYEEPDPRGYAPPQQLCRAATSRQASHHPHYVGERGLGLPPRPSATKNRIAVPSIAQLIEIADYAISIEVSPAGDAPCPSARATASRCSSDRCCSLKAHGGDGTTRQPFRSPGSPPRPRRRPRTPSAPSRTRSWAPCCCASGPSRRPGRPSSRPPACAASLGRQGPRAHDADPAASAPGPAPGPRVQQGRHPWWGAPFQGLDFYNLSGFHFRFLPTTTAAAARPGRPRRTRYPAAAGAHPVLDGGARRQLRRTTTRRTPSARSTCASPGSGNGGMARLKQEYADKNDPSEYNKLPKEAFDWLPMKQLEEHGGLWERDSDGRPKRTSKKVDTIQYPWHKWEAGQPEGGC
ncbi:hypothetical protein PG997_012948 [Apiospora hydei]|uniref:Aldos-2-ulose dehydratase/isomerase (AUDH) Cupin domain-containing protein n=1 Tax=Apiospora hydei TaxID=1337664 RepID=A0ABR1V7A7_9PEZI